jgi:hypothetical protein
LEAQEDFAMTHRLAPVWALGIAVAVFVTAAPAVEPTATESRSRAEAKALAARIDYHIAAALNARDVPPASRSGDGEFIRRAYLDLAGRIPDLTSARNFLDDRRPDKRLLWVEQLIADDRYAYHFANVWRATLLSRSADENRPNVTPGFESWLRERLRSNASYDQMVREIVTAPATPGNPGPLAFYLANEQKPENVAASVARLFLGVNLDCAQCHPHPFARWKREQFWELTAFFTPNTGLGLARVQIPNSDKVVEARFLDGKEPRGGSGSVPPAVLADWMTADDNPYFARAAVNRVWAYFFGIGLIEPVDEPGDQNPPSHPELLDELAQEFRAHHFDLQYLIRGIVASEAYQRSSADDRPADPRLFARLAVRGLSPEQLLDSLAVATGYPTQEAAPRVNALGAPNPSARAEFLVRFTAQGSRTETQTSILQALHMMNGALVGRAVDHSVAADAIQHLSAVDYPANKAKAVDTLYVLVLSRRPRPEEVERVIRYVDRAGDRPKALGDVLWALLNSAEFMLNH